MDNLRQKIKQSNQLTLDEREILEALLTNSENGNIRKSYEEVIGDGVNSDYIITHNLNNYNINISVQYTSNGVEVVAHQEILDSNRILISANFPVPISFFTVYVNV